MAGVGELVASAVVKELVSKLSSELWLELGLRWRFKDDLEGMKNTLESIQAVFNDAENRFFSNESVRLWLKRLEDVTYDIEDMLDELATQNWLFKSPARKLKGMRKRLDKIAEQRSSYNLREDAITYQQIIKDHQTDSTVDKGEVLGREGEVTEIINMLLSTTSNTTSVIPIVGLGGLGKTTLAKLIFNDDNIKNYFKSRIWIHAADFNVENLAEAILSSAGTGNGNGLTNRESKINGAKKVLDGKKFLIVLDDVWIEDVETWNDFKRILPRGEEESKIIVTARDEKVSSIMDATETQHKLKPLPDDVCLDLFERRAFGLAGAKDYHLASIGKEIVQKCQGVPLAVISLGGMLRHEKGRAAWKKVKNSDLWELQAQEGSGSSWKKEILPSLKLSYHYMPSPLKRCFVYCSSYPRAFRLKKDMLIQQWIAQRFIQTENEIEAVQIGDRYVNDLLSMSFLEEEKEEIKRFRWSDVNSYLKMHDMVYDLARWVAGNKVSVYYTKGSKTHIVKECRYASLSSNDEELKNKFPKVRALHFPKFGDCHETIYKYTTCLRVFDTKGSGTHIAKECRYFPKVRALHFPKLGACHRTIFKYTTCLRVLDFTDCSLYKLPNSIYKLKQLRYLRLPCRLNKVDDQVQNLLTLESLIISFNSYIKTLPTSIDRLHNLIYLEIFYATDLSNIPDSIVSLKKLGTLNLVGCKILSSLPESLGNLEKLATLTIYECDLRSLPNSLGYLVNLETLTIYHCALRSLPNSLGYLVNLKNLTIYDCWEIISLPETLSQLVNLKILAIGKLSKFAHPASIGIPRNLIDLDLSFFDKLLELPNSIGGLQKLYTLKLYGCHRLGSLPESLGNLKELRTLDIRGCAMLNQDELPTAICNMRHLKIQRDEPQELDIHLVDGDPEEEYV